MSEVLVTLPDGSQKAFPAGTRPLDIAQSISKRLAEDAIVAKVDGNLWDLTRPLEGDAAVSILTTKDPASLEVYRHSTAHLLAGAVLELWPETKLAIGPPIENGFYYDFDRKEPFTPEDLEKIEKKMAEIRDRDLTFERKLIAKPEGLAKYEAMNEPMKVELITERADDIFSEYTMGPGFIDFCRGPHVPSTKKLKAFKLLSVAGAYWKGDETRQQLQRIYGTAWYSQKELDEFLKQLEEAKKRDHRKLGRELDLISIQELAGPGLIFFHPKGAQVRKLIEDWMRENYLARGYDLVYTPHVARRQLWEVSGHAATYGENMFVPMELDDATYQLKPMNCPFHILIYANKQYSYRELPVRLGELGTVYRYERSGTLHGLLRVRGFCQDDAHIFCTPEQAEAEVVGCLDFAFHTLRTFGFETYEAELSTWDGGKSDKYFGSPEEWALAENALKSAVEKLGLNVKVIPDEAAFYGPKIDVKLVDAIGRKWQLSTVQFDFNLPRRFNLSYIAEDGAKHTPTMVHRALFGSVERFFGILVEHYAGAFPVWLAPTQVILLPVTDRANVYAGELAAKLTAEGFRVETDTRNEKVNFKIREAQLQKIPYMLVIGDREIDAGTVSVRNRRHGDLGAKPVDEFIALLREQNSSKIPIE
ncbi:threonine--tRNA ligase [Bryobacter aggregatus]|uniref:threonine--tRNA ligase n=1 Tax=Bryobacter aggregatus TaxID=360054 RepID=UPI0004E21683|nr:threonine--tRNA ligase [Bryobacter aggregatus]